MEEGEGLGLKGQPLSVCRLGVHGPIFLLFSLTAFSLQPAFAADSSTTDTAGVGPPTPALKPTRLDPRIALPLVSASALLLALLLAMGIFQLLRLRLRRRRSSRVVVVAEDGAESGSGAAVAVTGGGKDVEGTLVVAAAPAVVREFNREDIRRMTANFGEMIGSGGFSRVYMGRLSGEPKAAAWSGLAAVKVHTGSERLNMAFRQELDILLRIRHENIVKLIGFCDDEGEGALIFEYIPKGNLQEKLHSPGNGGTVGMDSVLSWRNRMAIAFQLVQAIEYLHEKCSPQIVHGDIKASNVLLDENLNSKLCDFGSAKMGFSSMVMPPSSSTSPRMKQIMMGSPGYTDPHYLRTGIASKKNDIYSFGVLLLELITGMEAFCSKRGQILTSIMAPLLGDGHSEVGPDMMDRQLNGDFNLKEAKAMVSLSRSCLQPSATLRPTAAQILESIRHKVPSVSF